MSANILAFTVHVGAAVLCAAPAIAAPAPSDAAVACADDLRGRAHIDLESGRRAFEVLELERAARHYGAAVQKLHRVAALTGVLDDLPSSLAMLAATYMLLQDDEAATVMAQRVVSLEPDFQPPRHIFNPNMLAHFEAARRAPVPLRGLTVMPSPSNTQIYIDGRLVGSGMLSLTVSGAVPHYIFAVSPGSISQGSVVEAGDLAADVHVTLVPPPGRREAPPCG